ncbi:MAG: hypothetical protein IKO32_06795 [Lachnospiraceae bacterium]|nr:hypothetical protein [Lachnospiraceae bacterium]
MELNEISNRGKLINGVIIGVNLVTYFAYFLGMWFPSDGIAVLQTIVRVLGAAIAIAGIVYTAILIKNNDGRLKGLGLCLAACIISLIFSVIGLMLGLIIWVVCGISIRQLDHSFREQATMDSWSNYADRTRLNNEIKDYANGNNNQAGYGDPYGYGGQGGYGYNDPNAYGGQGGYGYNDPNAYGNQGGYANQGYGYNDVNAYGNQGGYGNQSGYGSQGLQNGQNGGQEPPVPQEPKYASHPNGFGVQEEPEIDFSDL